jgi:ABC-type multidrug transport system ATPase subunit
MTELTLAVRNLSVQQGRRQAFRGVSFELHAGQALGVAGANGAGKSALLRALVGCIRPTDGEIRISGRVPRDALARTATAYFAGEATLPGFARASAWGSLGTGEALTPETRRIRTLPRGARQLLGLRTELGRHPLSLVILDEPWEGLDPDAARWLNATLETKRDRGAAVVVSSRRLEDLAGICDKYLFLTSYAPFLLSAHEIEPMGNVTSARLSEVFDTVRSEPSAVMVLPRRTSP